MRIRTKIVLAAAAVLSIGMAGSRLRPWPSPRQQRSASRPRMQPWFRTRRTADITMVGIADITMVGIIIMGITFGAALSTALPKNAIR